MTERTLKEVAAMTRRELARLHANEMSAALNPYPERPDDEIGADEKAAMQEAVMELRRQHMSELAACKAKG